MTDHTVNVSIDDDIASIILDRAEVRNALNRDTMVQFRDAALAVSDKDQVRAVIIRAEGTDFSVTNCFLVYLQFCNFKQTN